MSSRKFAAFVTWTQRILFSYRSIFSGHVLRSCVVYYGYLLRSWCWPDLCAFLATCSISPFTWEHSRPSGQVCPDRVLDLQLLGVKQCEFLRRVRGLANSDLPWSSVCQSVCPHGKSRTDFHEILEFTYFSKIYREYSNFIKLEPKKKRNFTWRSIYIYDNVSQNSS